MGDDIRREPSQVSAWCKKFEYSVLKLKMNSEKIDLPADLHSSPDLMSEGTKPGGSWPEFKTESSIVSLRAASPWQAISGTYWKGG